MAGAVTFQPRATVAPKASTRTDPALIRWPLIGIGLIFLALFLFLPLTAVFVNALEKGVSGYLVSIKEPDAFPPSA